MTDFNFTWFITVIYFTIYYESTANPALSSTATVRHLVSCHDIVETLLQDAEESGYQVEKMLEIAKG